MTFDDRDRQYVEDMLDAAQRIRTYTVGIDFSAFEQDQMRIDAVVRCFEILGEAAKRLKTEFREAHPEVEWHSAAKMRDYVIHHYDKVKPHRIWETVQDDIPPMIEQLETLVQSWDADFDSGQSHQI